LQVIAKCSVYGKIMKVTINVEVDTDNQKDVETVEDLIEILKQIKAQSEDSS
jgi:hypothetical protein